MDCKMIDSRGSRISTTATIPIAMTTARQTRVHTRPRRLALIARRRLYEQTAYSYTIIIKANIYLETRCYLVWELR